MPTILKHSLTRALMIAALLTPLLASAATASQKALDKALAKGKRLIEKGEYDDALKHLQKAEKLADQPPVPLLLDLALCLNQLGKSFDAETYARRALEKASNTAERGRAYNNLGVSLYSQAGSFIQKPQSSDFDLKGVLKEAESAFRAVLKLTGGNAPVVWYNLAQVLKYSGQDQEALGAFTEYLERAPEGPSAAEAKRAMDWIACLRDVTGDSGDGEAKTELLAVGEDVRPPKKTFSPGPQYTETARRARISGLLIFESVIDKQGDVRCLDVIQGLPMGLTESAVAAIRRWKFEPATRHGKPVLVRYHLVVNMRIGA